jgi:hypothetical protein
MRFTKSADEIGISDSPCCHRRAIYRVGQTGAKCLVVESRQDRLECRPKKRELEGVSDDPRTAETDGLSLRDLNTLGPTRARLGAPNATASARLGLGDPNTVKPDGSSVRLGQPKPKATK